MLSKLHTAAIINSPAGPVDGSGRERSAEFRVYLHGVDFTNADHPDARIPYTDEPGDKLRAHNAALDFIGRAFA